MTYKEEFDLLVTKERECEIYNDNTSSTPLGPKLKPTLLRRNLVF